ncbi:MAG: hypothetical protein Q9195_000512 [Heterodermia aff. obscurata]
MAGLQQPKTAADCFARLQQLKDDAVQSQFSRRNISRTKRMLLTGVVDDLKDCLRKLKAWREEFDKADQSQRPELLDKPTLDQTTNNLFDSIEKAEAALDARLRRQRPQPDETLDARLKRWRQRLEWIIHRNRPVLEKQLRDSLEQMGEAMKQLNNVSKVVRGTSAKQEDRDKRKTLVLESASKVQSSFSQRFSAVTQGENVLELALDMLWDHFPPRLNLENKVGNPDNPGDGILYDQEHVAQAKEVLQDLAAAWRKAEHLAHRPPSNLEDVSKICLILTGMQQQRLLLNFLRSGLTDADLRLDRQKLEEILSEEQRPYAALFYTEQYRAMPREWTEGSHGIFCEEEPMPLVFVVDPPLWGSFGSVMKVLDPFTGDLYVRKQQIVSVDEKVMESCRKHIEQETLRLKGLDHRHVVRFVKSYERGRVFGLIMKPAANYDLGRLLKRYKDNKFNHKAGCPDREWLRPVFWTAFGCLAKGLAYIHARNLRHKDVKPDNILYEQTQPTQNPRRDRFLWADFGLAYDFSDKEDSKTRSTKLYSPRYAPPEVVAANATEKSNSVDKLTSIEENGEAMLRAEMNPKASDEEIDAHGRAADRFALGCIYLELLSRLVQKDLPLKANNENKIMFSNNIEGLCTWAAKTKQEDCSAELRPLFDTAIAMIRPKPDERPGINEVIDERTLDKQKHSLITDHIKPTGFATEAVFACPEVEQGGHDPLRTQTYAPRAFENSSPDND